VRNAQTQRTHLENLESTFPLLFYFNLNVCLSVRIWMSCLNVLRCADPHQVTVCRVSYFWLKKYGLFKDVYQLHRLCRIELRDGYEWWMGSTWWQSVVSRLSYSWVCMEGLKKTANSEFPGHDLELLNTTFGAT
jgi:hypothetical protein